MPSPTSTPRRRGTRDQASAVILAEDRRRARYPATWAGRITQPCAVRLAAGHFDGDTPVDNRDEVGARSSHGGWVAVCPAQRPRERLGTLMP
jgi:hypothetical protein